MGKHLKITLSCAALTLVACGSLADQVPLHKEFERHLSSSFFVDVPKGFTFSELAPSKDFYYFGYPANSPSGMSLVEIHEKFRTCPLTKRHMPLIHEGVTNDPSAIWGQVKFIHTWDPLPGENDVFCRNVEEPYKTSAYAFCAEKDGKAVAICIQQMTDDEEMAKQIFESFRWTD